MLHRLRFFGHTTDAAVWVVLCVVVLVLGGFVLHRLASDHRPLVESVLVLALLEPLVSPISWSHHWSWMAVAPVAAFLLWRGRRWTSALVGVALVVGVVAPYWWGIQRGIGSFLADNSFVLVGTLILFAWASSLLPVVSRARPRFTPG